MLQTIEYKGYLFKERKSILEEVGTYWAIYKIDNVYHCHKKICVVPSLRMCKYNVDFVFNKD